MISLPDWCQPTDHHCLRGPPTFWSGLFQYHTSSAFPSLRQAGSPRPFKLHQLQRALRSLRLRESPVYSIAALTESPRRRMLPAEEVFGSISGWQGVGRGSHLAHRIQGNPRGARKSSGPSHDHFGWFRQIVNRKAFTTVKQVAPPTQIVGLHRFIVV